MASRGSVHGSFSRNNAIVSRLAQQDKVPWYEKPNLRLLYLLMFPTCLGVEMTNGFDASMLNGLQAVPSWVESLLFVSSVVDEFGRQRSILIGSIITIIGGVLQGAALNLTMFIIARFVLGSGSILATVAAASLIGELSHPKERAIMGALFNCCYSIGTLTAAGVTLGTFAIPNNWGWRIPSFLQVVPGLLQVSFVWFLPESPRWLVSKGKGVEACTILVKFHAEGDENSEFVKAEYTQIVETLEEEMKNSQMSWKEAFSTAGMRKRAIIAASLGLFSRWSGNGLFSYFLSPILDNIGIHDDQMKNIVNFAKGGWDLIIGTFLALTVPRFPRRRMYLACAISLLVIFIAWTVANAQCARTHSVACSRTVLALIFGASSRLWYRIQCSDIYFLGRAFPISYSSQGYYHIPVVGLQRRVHHPIHGSYCNRGRGLEILHRLLRVDLV
ncbi:hypothetical protein HD554DRAFT_30230 [Boletus coccyginus]|nr:hypothetical protein HD554DRAFT_30230 [Boletus coccyginus]